MNDNKIIFLKVSNAMEKSALRIKKAKNHIQFFAKAFAQCPVEVFVFSISFDSLYGVISNTV